MTSMRSMTAPSSNGRSIKLNSTSLAWQPYSICLRSFQRSGGSGMNSIRRFAFTPIGRTSSPMTCLRTAPRLFAFFMPDGIGARSWLSAAVFVVLTAPATADPIADWRDLQARCGLAMERGEALDLAGLEGRRPGMRPQRSRTIGNARVTTRGPARARTTTVPTGVWAHPLGRFEMRLIEYPTAAGSRAICEVIPRRGAPVMTEAETAALRAAFEEMRLHALASGRWRDANFSAEPPVIRLGVDRIRPNPRGCPVVASLTIDTSRGYVRSSVSETAQDLTCGGASLFSAGRTDL